MLSTEFGFTENLTLASYVPKVWKAVIRLSSRHHAKEISDREDKKPQLIREYNAAKGCWHRWPTPFYIHLFLTEAKMASKTVLQHDCYWILQSIYPLVQNESWQESDGYYSLNYRRNTNAYLHSTVLSSLDQIGIARQLERRPPREGVDCDRCHVCPIRKVTRRKCTLCGHVSVRITPPHG